MKNESGKSAIIWILGIVILIIGIVYAVQFLGGEVEKENQKTIKTEMLQVQAKAKIILEQHHVDNQKELKGEKMEDTSLEETFGITEISKYYKWNPDTLKEVGIKDVKLKEGEYYLVNYDTEEVIYFKGYQEEEGKQYYKLSEIKEK